MIPRDYISEWREYAPWIGDAQVEQDLVISRALVEIFRVPELARALAFRGGTALFKLHLRPAARYSEDIDLVQVVGEPIGKTVDGVRAVLDSWLDVPGYERKEHSFKLIYRFQSEEQPPKGMRLKIEINSREHFTEHGHVEHSFEVRSRWWSAEANVTTFSLDELLGTKLRALFQRRKGRDLFDLWYALEKGSADPEKTLSCFHRYMRESGHKITRTAFEENLAAKLLDDLFLADITPLLRPGIDWNLKAAAQVVSEKLLSNL